MDSLEPLLQGVSHGMTLDEIMALANTVPNGFDIHERYSGAFAFYFLRLTPAHRELPKRSLSQLFQTASGRQCGAMSLLAYESDSGFGNIAFIVIL
jgi:hypothetical protein